MNFKDILKKSKQEEEIPLHEQLSIICSNFMIANDTMLNALINTICAEYNLSPDIFTISPIFDKETFSIKFWSIVTNHGTDYESFLIHEPSLLDVKNQLKSLILADKESPLFKDFEKVVLSNGIA